MSNNQKIAYLRVSSVSQNEARQREAMQGKGIDKFFVDNAVAKIPIDHNYKRCYLMFVKAILFIFMSLAD